MPIKSKGLKKYDLREKILTTLKNSKSPISVKDLGEKLNLDYHKTSIYRQLENLFKNQKVHKIEIAKETLFEISSHSHIHFLCVKCSLVTCVDLPINFNLNLLEEGLKGFEILDTNINLKGLCQECKLDQLS